MTIVYQGNNYYTGVAGDTKPTNIPNGSTFEETDTNTLWKRVGGAWVELSVREGYDYLVYPVGALDFKVKKGSNGRTVYTSSNVSVDALGALQYCRDQMGETSPGGYTVLTSGYFPVSATFDIDGDNFRYQSYKGVGNGSQYGSLSEIRALGDFPAITFTGTTNSVLGMGLEGLHLSHNTAAYSNGLIRVLDTAVENTFKNLSFSDTARDAGDCFKFEILNTSSQETQYENKIFNCNCRGFDNFIHVNNQADNATHTSFISTLDVSNCNAWNVKRVLKVAGVSGAKVLDWHFHRVNFQYDSGNAVAANAAVFDYDSSVSCWQHKHSYCMIWDITGPGINYANVGSSVELALRECNPSHRIGGSSAYLNKVSIDEYYAPSTRYQAMGLIGPVSVGDGTRIGDGVLSNCTIIQTPTISTDTTSSYLVFASGASADTLTGTRRGSNPYRIDHKPMFETQCSTSVVTSDARMFVGFTTAPTTSGTTNTPLSTTDSGILIGYGSADTNYQVYHHDGDGSAATKIDTGIPKATALAKLSIICSASSFTYIIATAAGGFIVSPLVSSQIPVSTTPMSLIMYGVNTTTTPINFNMRYAKLVLRSL